MASIMSDADGGAKEMEDMITVGANFDYSCLEDAGDEEEEEDMEKVMARPENCMQRPKGRGREGGLGGFVGVGPVVGAGFREQVAIFVPRCACRGLAAPAAAAAAPWEEMMPTRNSRAFQACITLRPDACCVSPRASQDLDPASFRDFVEGAVKGLHLTDRPAVHEGEGGASVKTGARLGYNTYVGQLPRIVVKVAAPHAIVGVSPALKEVLGFHEKEMIGRSLNIVQGPMTNVALLSQKIIAAAGGEVIEEAFILYTNKGEDRVVTIEFEPEISLVADGDIKITQVILTVEHGDWVPKKIADADDGRAKVTVKAVAPYSVEQTSPAFNLMYGLKESLILNRTLNVIFGPRTDATMFRQLLQRAKAAKTQHVDMWTTRPADMSNLYVRVTIFPVLDKGEILHYMVVFKRDEMAGSPLYTSPRRQRPGTSPISAVARMSMSDNEAGAGVEAEAEAGAGPPG